MHKTYRRASLALGAFALAGLSAHAQAAWVFSNDSGGDGSIAIDASQDLAFTITGSDNGVGDNTSLYLQTFAKHQIVTFTWQYASLDTDSTAYDQAGVIDNGDETQLSLNGAAHTPSSGIWTVDVAAGHTFGFYVHSNDSLGGAALFAVNETLATPPPPPPPPAIPEPQMPALMLAGLAALFAAVRRKATRGE